MNLNGDASKSGGIGQDVVCSPAYAGEVYHQYGSTSPDRTSMISDIPEGFRRTPGARRPSVVDGSGNRTDCESVPKPLVFDAPVRSSSSWIDNLFLDTGKYFLPLMDNTSDRTSSASASDNCSSEGLVGSDRCGKNNGENSDEGGNAGIGWTVSNLDYNIYPNERKNILTSEFQQNAEVSKTLF